ncbi:MAG: phosphoglycerate dehydrogenase [Alphaproteobacteria bacterium]|nr:phosphoglycerate dehydrogenase [Alphaproteobacteria bacterium]
MPKVLIADKMSPRAAEIFRERGVEVDVNTGLAPEELAKIIGAYDGLAVRSSTKATDEIIAAAANLKVIGRAGIGVDNVDIPAATARGIVVMNTPFGNSITTAEHAIAMMMTLARQIPLANASTQSGKWEKSRFMGVELYNKVLGVIGCGNIGSIAARLAIGLKMRVIAYDPYLSADRASELGVTKVELDELLRRADMITLHVPLTDETRDILDADALAKTKPGVRIVNCARGGLINEDALKAAIESGHVAGAALDVFANEPARENPLFGMEQVVATPHLGASTEEAQVNVAVQVAEQMSDFLLDGAVTNAVNMPSVGAEEMAVLGPYMTLAEQLGSFAGQLTTTGIRSVTIEYEGDAAALKAQSLTAVVLAGLLRPQLDNINAVNAPAVAKERGIDVREVKCADCRHYRTLMRLTVVTERQERAIAGTLFADDRPRIVNIKGIPIEAELTPDMLYITNDDKPGLIGAMGRTLGDADVNIATFALGRSNEGGDAIALVAIDGAVPDDALAALRALPAITQVMPLRF